MSAEFEARDRMAGVALRDHVAGTAFALPTLRGDAEFELDVFEAHAVARMANDLAVGDAAADTDDHGVRGAEQGMD